MAGRVLAKPMIVYKELKVSKDDKGHDIARAPSRGTKWGIVKPGRVLRAKAIRNSGDCDRGVHAWRAPTRGWGGNSLWAAVIPAGSWVLVSLNKVRTDAIILVHEIVRT